MIEYQLCDCGEVIKFTKKVNILLCETCLELYYVKTTYTEDGEIIRQLEKIHE